MAEQDTWNERRRQFGEKHPRFFEFLPALIKLRDSVFYRKIAPKNQAEILAFALGSECAEIFEEILLCASHQYGRGASRLMRTFYERMVVGLFFLKNPDKIDSLLNDTAIDLGQLLRGIRQTGQRPDWPPEVIRDVEEGARIAREKRIFCEKCGGQKARVDVLSMARDVEPPIKLGETWPAGHLDLVNLAVVWYSEATKFVHATGYSLLTGFRQDEANLSYLTRPNPERSAATLRGAHWLLLGLMTGMNQAFNFGLDADINEARRQFDEAWPPPTP